MAKPKRKDSDSDGIKLVSFKLASDLYGDLEKYATSQRDEGGFKLSPSQAARRLVLEALRRLKK